MRCHSCCVELFLSHAAMTTHAMPRRGTDKMRDSLPIHTSSFLQHSQQNRSQSAINDSKGAPSVVHDDDRSSSVTHGLSPSAVQF